MPSTNGIEEFSESERMPCQTEPRRTAPDEDETSIRTSEFKTSYSTRRMEARSKSEPPTTMVFQNKTQHHPETEQTEADGVGR